MKTTEEIGFIIDECELMTPKKYLFLKKKWYSEEDLLELKQKCMEWQEKARKNEDLTNSHRDGFRAGLSQAICLIDEMMK